MNDKEGNVLTFEASLPQIQSAINLDGHGLGARVKLDVPAAYMDEIRKLHRLGAGKPLKIIVEILPVHVEPPNDHESIHI